MSKMLFVRWQSFAFWPSAIAFLDAADRVEEIAEGELHELHPASLRLVTPDKGWMISLRQELLWSRRRRIWLLQGLCGTYLGASELGVTLADVSVSAAGCLVSVSLLCSGQDLLDAV